MDMTIFRDTSGMISATKHAVQHTLLDEASKLIKEETYHDDMLHGTVYRARLTLMKF
jgi:hypothetical protein